jgi:hypothetical protein
VTAVVILLLSIAVSFIVVRIGAVAFELTGIPWQQAKFQALSAFTNCGYTTREAEDVVRHPVRRRIATIMIVLGNAGLVAVIGSFAGSIACRNGALTTSCGSTRALPSPASRSTRRRRSSDARCPRSA